MKKFIVNHVWWITLLLGLGMLLAHTFSFNKITVDNTSIILLLVIFLSPFISAITKIKYGEFEAEIDPKEVQKIKDDVSAQVASIDEPTKNSEIEKTVDSISGLVDSDPILALAKLRIELEKVINNLYRMTLKGKDSDRFISPTQLIRKLWSAQILPRDIADTTREVISVCNRAIHGEDIRKQDAASVVESGVSLLIKLSFYGSRYILEPIETSPIDKSTLDEYRDAKYRVTSIVPLTETPYKTVRVLDQEGIDELLEGYNNYGEFIIEVARISPEDTTD
jgi:hypothetical protein